MRPRSPNEAIEGWLLLLSSPTSLRNPWAGRDWPCLQLLRRGGIASLSEVAFVPSAPEYAEKLYNVIRNMWRGPGQTIEEELCELPFRLNYYTWAGWIDETGALMLPEGHWRLEEEGITGGWRGRRPPAEEAQLSAEEVTALDRVWSRIQAEYEVRMRRWAPPDKRNSTEEV